MKLMSVNEMFEVTEAEMLAEANSPQELAKEVKRSAERLERLAARFDLEEVEEVEEEEEDDEE